MLGTLADPGAIAVLVETSGLGISRVVASLRQVGRKEFAERIERELAGSGFRLPQVKDPFEPDAVYQLQAMGKSPLYARVRLLWKEHREEVLAMRPTPPPAWPEIAFLQQVEAAKLEDAYHLRELRQGNGIQTVILPIESKPRLWLHGVIEYGQRY
ncbi:hypothetical protein GGI1_24041, partial [Acidithiobacillus sp. GGI-221]